MCTRKALGVITGLAVLCMLGACGKDKPTGPNVTPFWTVRQTLGTGYQLDGASWGDAGFVAVGYTNPQGTSVSLTSPDGVLWSSATPYPLATGQMGEIVWTGTKYVAMSNPQGLSASIDGTVFTELTAYTAQPVGIAWSGDFLAATATASFSGESVVDTSVDGTVWGRIAATMPWNSVSCFEYGGGQWIVVELGSTPRIFRSTDLHTWTESAQLSAEARDVAWSGSAFLLVTGHQAYRSTTGETWTAVTLPDMLGRAVVWAGTAWIVAGSETYKSADGTTWSTVSEYMGYSIRDLAWNGQVLVGVGLDGKIFTATL